MNRLLLPFLLLTFATQAQNILRVNNNVGVNAPYITISAAIAAAAVNDIIMVEGSITAYDNITINKKVTIVGPGYYLLENLNLQGSPSSASLASVTFAAGSDGSSFYGLNITGGVGMSSTVNNLTISNCRLGGFQSNFVSGQFTSNYHLVLKGKIGMVGVVFRPSSLHNFFGLRMSQLANSRMSLELLLPEKAESIWTSVKVGKTKEDRIKILQEFLLSLLPTAKAQLSVVDEAVELIDHHKGSISVEAVAEQLKISRRYLEKKFLEKVGVSPKFYARIKRFVSLSKEVAYNKNFDWQDIVFEYGFHDQSHLVKEFMEFNQMNPSDYHLKHNELIRFVKR